MGFILSGMFLRDSALYCFVVVVVVHCGHLFTLENTPSDPHLSEKGDILSWRGPVADPEGSRN